MTRAVRFGFQISGRSERDPVTAAKRAEQLGFDTVLVSDHVGLGRSPIATLGAIATATETIRLGTFVLNNDMRNPVQLAWEATTLDRLSGGRFELGLGAGHTPAEYAATGIEQGSPGERKIRLAECVEVIRRLLDGETVTYTGAHINISGAAIDKSVQERLPILVGGNGNNLLRHAARHADIIGLQGLGRTHDDGHRHDPKWSVEHLDAQIADLDAGAADLVSKPERNAMVQVVEITDNRTTRLQDICAQTGGLAYDDAATTPYLLVGTVREIIEQIERASSTWGITYFVVRTLDQFEPVLRAFDKVPVPQEKTCI